MAANKIPKSRKRYPKTHTKKKHRIDNTNNPYYKETNKKWRTVIWSDKDDATQIDQPLIESERTKKKKKRNKKQGSEHWRRKHVCTRTQYPQKNAPRKEDQIKKDVFEQQKKDDSTHYKTNTTQQHQKKLTEL